MHWLCCTLHRTDDLSEQTYELLDVLVIAPQLPFFHKTLLPLISTLVSTVAATSSDVARAAFISSAASPAQVLGAALLSFSRIASVTKNTDTAVAQGIADNVVPMIEGFAWHRGVMAGIAALQLSRLAADKSPESQTRIYDALLPNLFSEDSSLRLSSLQIAASLFPTATAPVAADLIAKCIEVEEMPLSVQGAREKSMKVRKLGIVANGQLGRDGEDVTPALDVVLRYLTGELSLLPGILRPLTESSSCSDAQGQLQALVARSDPGARPPLSAIPRPRLDHLLPPTSHSGDARIGPLHLSQAGMGRRVEHPRRRRRLRGAATALSSSRGDRKSVV